MTAGGKTVKKQRRALLALFALLAVQALLQAQSEASGGGQRGYVTGGDDVNAIKAAEEFRVGVQAYNRYSFNEAILSF